MLKLLIDETTRGYLKDLSKFAWLAQFISQMLGNKTDVYKEVMKSLNSTFSNDDNVDRWKSSAKKKGLRTGGES